ncbi:MAG: hypothetical protein LUE10_04155 [Alistipes sp.]|nr:hypothetical protein [Alistipes sp.]
MRTVIILAALTFLFPSGIFAQNGNSPIGAATTAPPAHTGAHHHERNEIGVSLGTILDIDGWWGSGVHFHYFRRLGDHSRWSVGTFAEQARIDDFHFSMGAGVRYEPVGNLSLGLYPGYTISEGDIAFSTHVEVVYDILSWKNFHLGPVFEYSWSREDSHFMLGVHWAYCF